MDAVVVAYADARHRAQAEELAAHVDAPCICALEVDASQLALHVDASGLSLARDGMVLTGDFTRMMPRLRQGALQRELLVRAARIKGEAHPCAVDATAGLGEDALLLAAAGFEVVLCESDPVIAALLVDACRRGAQCEQLAPIVARMHVVERDSSRLLAALPEPVDVVYLDPMFPGRTKSAAVKKKFQLIHGLERPCDAEAERALMTAAMRAARRKVVVKRPVKGPYLAGVKPSHSLTGKAVRYDCIVPTCA